MIGTDETHDSMFELRRTVLARLFGDEPRLETLGRYRLEHAIGSGGMGTVYAAQDPELDRKVAVKLLHGSRGDDEGRRLLQEAKGLARLSHANVVQVYDVGTVGGRVFLAMELVEGSDLRQWLAEAPRDWTKVVETFICAGHGLAAAHAAGLVHRDFKPENVLVRDDGVVKVADFGLVRSTVSPFRTDPGSSEDAPDGAVDSLTRTGTSVGTPAYMSPEQHLALDTDARTDQYSFCVALFESIYGRRPFVADTLHGLIDAARSERVVFPRRPRVPRALKQVLRRGLRARREDRYPDMAAMLRDLGSLDRPKRRWLPILAGVGLLGLTFAGLFVGLFVQRGPSRADATNTCDARARVEEVWNPEVEAGLRQRLTAVDAEIGPRAAESAKAGIDDYVASWTTAYATTCEATGDEDLAAAQRLCLTSRLDRLRGAISVLAQADGAIASSTPQIVAALEPVEECLSELTVVRRDTTLPELVFELSRASSLWHARQPTEALAVAQSVAERAAQAGDRNTEAEAWLLTGIVARFEPVGEQRPEQSTHALEAALRVAREIGDTRLGLRAEVLLAWDPGPGGEVHPSTLLDELAPRVEASSDPFAKWAFHCGWAFMKVADPDESRAVHARALLDLAEAHFGSGHRLLEVSQWIASRSGVTPPPSSAEQAGRVEAVAGMFGANSRRAAEVKMELAKALRREGKLEEARARYDEAVAAWTEAEGEESTGLGDAWRRIAALEMDRGNLVAALEAYDAAIEALKSNPAVDHKGEDEVLFAAWMGRAQVLAELDRAEEAVAAIDHARTLRHEPARLEWWGDLAGKLRRSTGDLSGALAEYTAARASHGLDAAALERWRADPAAIHTHIAAVFASLLVGEAEVRLDLGQASEAEANARFAWDRLREVTEDRAQIEALQARAGLVLARTIAKANPSSAEPSQIAEAALAGLAAAEDGPAIARLREALEAIAR
jgi:tetratricopeptide (TPR) repeat protein/predicted Ser/Thr protein kinase